MPSKFRCQGCKDYFPIADTYRTAGLGRVCSAACQQTIFERQRDQKATSATSTKTKSKRTLKDGLPDEMRKLVRERDHNRCTWCGIPRSLHVHHINYRSQGGPHEPWNLITLCQEHHDLVHSNKRKYQPLCRGYIWQLYVEGYKLRLPRLLMLLEAGVY